MRMKTRSRSSIWRNWACLHRAVVMVTIDIVIGPRDTREKFMGTARLSDDLSFEKAFQTSYIV
ncbi:hypothetical protein AGR3A_Cc200027 [Agrobacterium tomkonis CFBP 6623]|uniref:Uncharacterized protein n=1 Tax=Agrobacterium tomkonis CFBP 6623 TaxID=1183432 RepID=A0A1S7P8Q5_9HYPH|nr:hypothetical protein AGR3A_Cc200027 [Agrobacterium tomkonis CFBP 6623]